MSRSQGLIRPLESDDFCAAGGKVGGLERGLNRLEAGIAKHSLAGCLLYTSDAADEL